MIAGVGSRGSWEDPCSLDQWDPSIPWCGHVLLMKGVFLDPNLGPRFEMAQIREFLSRSAWSAVQGIEANVDVDDVDVDVCRGQSMTEYDLHVRGCWVFFGMGRICCTAQTTDEGHGRFRIQPSKFGWYPLMKTLILQVPIHLMVPVVYIYR